MAEDLDFPDNDDLTFDFEQNLLGDDHINPMIPNPEFSFPQILPAGISRANQQQINFGNLNVNNINNVNSSYQPINQLMRQTQQLASTLNGPLNSNINSNLNYGNQLETNVINNLQSPAGSNNVNNFVGQSVPKNSQYLVVGGQRIQVPASQQLQQPTIQPTLLKQSQGSHGDGSSLLNIAQPGALTNSNFLAYNSQHVSTNRTTQPQSQPQLQQQQQQNLQQSAISPNVLNIQSTANQQSSNLNKLPTNMNMNTQTNNPKQPLVLKVPQNQQQSQQLSQNNGGQFKGSIIKTADHQLMFVTEVNGKKVGYVIQQQKQPPPNSQSSLPVGVGSPSINSPCIPSPGVPSPKAPSPGVPSPNMSAPSPSSISSGSPLQQILSKNCVSIQDIDISKLKQSQLSPSMNSLGSNSIANIEDIDIAKIKTNKDEPVEKNLKKEEKSLLERLQGIGSTLKNNVNLKAGNRFSNSTNKTNALTNPDKMQINEFIPSKVVQMNPVIQQVNTVSRSHSDFDGSLLPDDSNDMNFEEEEGQEIEFSENDLTTDANEDSDDPLITEVRGRDSEDTTGLSQQIMDDEDSDSLPLALLKNDETIPIVCEKSTPEKAPAKNRKFERETSDSLPLSVVAASLKKSSEHAVETNDTTKKKKRPRKKKKDNDAPPKPIFAYQLFFREVQHQLKEENPMYKENFGELSKKIGQLWEVLDPEKKKVYQDTYAAAKTEYTIKLAEYNQKKAKEAELAEALSPSSSLADENSRDKLSDGDHDDDDDENAPLKKTAKKKAPTKKANNNNLRKKLTATTIATTTTLSPPSVLEELHAKDGTTDSTPSPEAMEVDGPSHAAQRKTRSKKPTPTTDSPSPPSSDTNSSDEDDEDDHISRIRLLAASASKQLRKIEKKTVKGKTKEVSGTKRHGRVTKMEVETVSEKVVIEHMPPPVFDVKQPPTTTATPEVTTAPPSPPQSKVSLPLARPEPAKTISSPMSSPKPTTKMSTRAKSIKQPVKEITIKKEKLKSDQPVKVGTDKPSSKNELIKSTTKDNVKIEKTPSENLPSPPASKPSFKIPKRTHGENGQILPQGPRLCVRDVCQNPVKTTRERGGQYCSNECLVLYCREVFDSWVIERQSEGVQETT